MHTGPQRQWQKDWKRERDGDGVCLFSSSWRLYPNHRNLFFNSSSSPILLQSFLSLEYNISISSMMIAWVHARVVGLSTCTWFIHWIDWFVLLLQLSLSLSLSPPPDLSLIIEMILLLLSLCKTVTSSTLGLYVSYFFTAYMQGY